MSNNHVDTFHSHADAFHERTISSGTMMSTSDTMTLSGSPMASGFSKPNSPTSPLDTTVSNTLPPDHPYRTLVLCFDGTGDQFDADNSNIVEFFSMLKKDDPDKQLVYYQAGIGTYTTPQIATPMASKISKTLDMAVAWNLDAHIMDGYEFLMQNYKANDKICIFGFSRGAYTARCLAGMIHKVGLLPTCNHQQVPFAYKMYTKADPLGWKQSNAFKKAFSNPVNIEFLGVWDTVNSVGLIPRRLPFTTSNTVVNTFRHAMALDERRAKFKANLWNKPTAEEEVLSITDRSLKQETGKHKQKSPSANGKASQQDLERRYSKYNDADTDIKEVWFAGCHCDIGGGSVTDGVEPCLARIPLRWMIRECFGSYSGILFHVDGLKKIGLDPSRLYPKVLPRPPALSLDHSSPETCIIQAIPKESSEPDYCDDEVHDQPARESEEVLELKDALAPIYDQLSLAWFWWILEFIPFRHRYQENDHSWATPREMNMGRGRHIPNQKSDKVLIHRSVKTRLEAKHEDGSKYKPKVTNLDMSCVEWVD